jgi:two-component system response regulator RegA
MEVLLADAGAAAARLRNDLESYGFRVHLAHSRADADEMIERHAWAGVTLEAMVLEAVVDGQLMLDLVQTIRSRYPAAPVVFVTCYACLEWAQAAIRLGATDYLTKPVTAAQLAAILRAGQREGAPAEQPPFDLPSVRRAYIFEILSASKTLSAAARVLGIERRSLRRMLERHGLRKLDSSAGALAGRRTENLTERVCSTCAGANAGRYPAAQRPA